MTKNKKVILEIEGLKKYFSNNGLVNKAADNITFNVHEGEIVGLIGESGSGKTTVGRSLLRLYDDFNGFVRLNGKIVSGRHLNRKYRKFLRKNIQMIFQDPHAALNGQKNVYSTLREPLIVNGIIKNRLNDIFSDWKEIIANFKFTFEEKYKQLSLQNLNSINDLAKEFFPIWKKKFDEYQYDSSLDFEDGFNVFYNYLEEKQNMESQIIDNMYNNTDDLINFYYQKQNDYRSGNIDLDESELVKAEANLKKVKLLTKMSRNKFNYLQLEENYVKKLQALVKESRENYIINRNTFYSYLNEFRNEIKIDRYNRLAAKKLDYWLFNLKNELINVKLKNLIKHAYWSLRLHFLFYEDVKTMIFELKKYAQTFYKEFLEDLVYEVGIKKKIKQLIIEKFEFDFAVYIAKNEANRQNQLRNQYRYAQKINSNKYSNEDESAFAASEEDLKNAQARYDKALEVHHNEVKNYEEQYTSIINELDEKIKDAKNLYIELKSMQDYTDKKFKEISSNFLNQLKEAAKNHKKSSEIKKLIQIYHNRIKTKLTTLGSFSIEVKYLNKDLKAIRKLLNMSDRRINNRQEKKITFLSKYWRRRSIKNLLIKTTIYKSLEDVGLLKQFAYRYPHEFSGGQRQRIVIARALITEPKVIVADEPIASLDISIQAQVVNLLKDLCDQKNIGMIFIAHDLSMIEYIANRVQIMHLGKIVESGSTKKVFAKPMHPYTINLFKAIPKISNANEKFENISFELNYLQDQKYPNVPEIYTVEEDHYLYGTEKQIAKWTKKAHSDYPYHLQEAKHENYGDYSEEVDVNRLHKPFDGHKEIPNDVQYTQTFDLKQYKTSEVHLAQTIDDEDNSWLWTNKPQANFVETNEINLVGQDLTNKHNSSLFKQDKIKFYSNDDTFEILLSQEVESLDNLDMNKEIKDLNQNSSKLDEKAAESAAYVHNFDIVFDDQESGNAKSKDDKTTCPIKKIYGEVVIAEKDLPQMNNYTGFNYKKVIKNTNYQITMNEIIRHLNDDKEIKNNKVVARNKVSSLANDEIKKITKTSKSSSKTKINKSKKNATKKKSIKMGAKKVSTAKKNVKQANAKKKSVKTKE